MSFIAGSPLDKENQVQMPMGRQIQGGVVQGGDSGLTKVASMAAAPVAEAAFTAGANALAGSGTAGLATLGGALGGTAGAATGLAAAAPMLAAAGPFALMALPFLLKDGTPGVPEMDYGPDPLQGYMNGTNKVPGYKNGIPGVPGLASKAMDKLGIKGPMGLISGVGKALGFNDGTNSVPGYMNGTSSITPTTAMHLAGGKDTVPAMLTPGEAVIGSAAAQNPANIPDINRMLNETRSANLFAEGKDPNNFEKLPEGNQMASMSGPLSGKAQREQMQVLQNMSLKKKAAEADEARKQEMHKQKYAHNDMKAMLSMRQS